MNYIANNTNPVQKAIDLMGNQTALARQCGVTQQRISQWLQRGEIPPRKVLLVEKITGIPRQQLNPEIYPYE